MLVVLLVEDDPTIRRATELILTRDGFEVSCAPDAESALSMFSQAAPDLVVLDVMLPGMDGVELCRRIRLASMAPVVMLSARGDPIDIVVGLEAGADDYVVKPFESSVLVARLRAVLRRSGGTGALGVLRIAEIEIDSGAVTVRRGGELVPMTPTEYRLLCDLAQNVGIARSRDDLLRDVWGYSWRGDTRLVDVHVARLRAKLGQARIETVRGIGYRLER